MIDPWNDLVDGFRTPMAAAWPEVVPNGIWEAEEALQRSFDSQLTPPYAVIDVARLPESGRYGVANRAWEIPYSLYYISEVEGDSIALRAKMKLLADLLDRDGLPAGQLIPRNPSVACGRDLEPNALLILLNATQRAGQVSGTVVTGVRSSVPSHYAPNPV